MVTAKIVALAVLGALLGYLSMAFYTASFDITTWGNGDRLVGIILLWIGVWCGAIVGGFK